MWRIFIWQNGKYHKVEVERETLIAAAHRYYSVVSVALVIPLPY